MLRIILWTIFVLATAVAGALAISYWRFTSEIQADLDRLLASAATTPGAIVTEAMLAPLPAPAQRYFRLAGIVGKPIPRIVRLKQKGRIRSGPSDDWMSLEADETYTTNPPGLVWRAFLPSATMPMALGRDEYLEGKGSILIKMLATSTLADEHGDELGAAALLRYFNEAMWFPAALLGSNVTISPADDDSFNAAIADRGMRAEATFYVDADGRLTNFRAQRMNTTTRSIETWETPVGAYGTLNGLSLPTRGSAVWKLPDGDFSYIELEISDLRYEN